MCVGSHSDGPPQVSGTIMLPAGALFEAASAAIRLLWIGLESKRMVLLDSTLPASKALDTSPMLECTVSIAIVQISSGTTALFRARAELCDSTAAGSAEAAVMKLGVVLKAPVSRAAAAFAHLHQEAGSLDGFFAGPAALQVSASLQSLATREAGLISACDAYLSPLQSIPAGSCVTLAMPLKQRRGSTAGRGDLCLDSLALYGVQLRSISVNYTTPAFQLVWQRLPLQPIAERPVKWLLLSSQPVTLTQLCSEAPREDDEVVNLVYSSNKKLPTLPGFLCATTPAELLAALQATDANHCLCVQLAGQTAGECLRYKIPFLRIIA